MRKGSCQKLINQYITTPHQEVVCPNCKDERYIPMYRIGEEKCDCGVIYVDLRDYIS